ncbi:ethanolamine utilization protein EutN [Alkalispirochaeta americana]|uniref:Ethanolamine utilization protein EutN n=1 Tax=Alkalispirochaeta americana TaxID=159291 RepID=A0A1N6U076_9SPIO|nr:EutN/CcmL family microcompartment protein [Alkalispirochaeta americana]SIQ58947.1 ethanolamine utilization protein EutN [Alkalispirochaeta americana]
MIIARVIGSVVSTIKEPKLVSQKLLILRQCTSSGDLSGPEMVAIDTVGAGTGELVIVALGSAARETDKTEGAPVDAAIVGVIDSLEVESGETFRKE